MLWFLRHSIAGLHWSTAWSEWRQHQKAFIWKYGRLSGWMFWRGFQKIWNETKGTWENTKTRTCRVRHSGQPIIIQEKVSCKINQSALFYIEDYKWKVIFDWLSYELQKDQDSPNSS